jgi:pimeloyl-ACP methyl ester carboxylesterase
MISKNCTFLRVAVALVVSIIGASSTGQAHPHTPNLQAQGGTLQAQGGTLNPPTQPAKSGYMPVNGLNLYYEIRGGGGTPLVFLHGGLHNTALDAPVAARFAAHRQLIAIDLQGHGRTADIDRPLRFELMADDVAALLGQLGIAQADLFGYSLGGGVALRTAIQHPECVRKLVLVSIPFSDTGWFPEVTQAFKSLNHTLAEPMRPSPIYRTYAAVAPHPDQFPKLLDKMGELQTRSYDWSAEIAKLTLPTMLVYADADAVPPSHIVRFFELLGGGKRDGGLDGSGMSKARLAILPGLTHYNVFESPALVDAVEPFLADR